MTTGTIICVRGEPGCPHWVMCYYPSCTKEATLQCDYRVDHWGNTCDAWMCPEHSIPVGVWIDHCTGHEPPKNQSRMAL